MDKKNILTPLQSQCLDFLFLDSWFRRHFYLTGGTALAAFYLHHRYSDDLDFFSHEVELGAIPNLMKALSKHLGKPVKAVQTSPAFMRYLVADELQVDVVGDVAFRVGGPELVGNFMVDSLKNIAVNKVCCLLGRLDAKDYVDLYLLFQDQNFDIFELLELGQKKDTGLEPFVWASLIGDVDRLKIMPRMITQLSLVDLKSFYHELRDQVLDSLKPQKE